jgi:diguanylate cyclase (GGDEF)-like protein
MPVIFVTGHSGAMCEAAGFRMGAADFIAKPVSAPVVLARVQAQLRRKHEADLLRRQVTHDGLTQLANRVLFNQSIEHEWLHARRGGEPLALLLIAVDHFKLYNQRYGLAHGDACLQHLAQSLACAGLHPGDLVARYSGAEFVMLLPRTSRGGAEHVAQRILDLVDALEIPHGSSLNAGHVTVSIGAACYDEASACWSKPSGGADRDAGMDGRARASAGDLLLAADRALSCAKLAGRGQARLLDLADLEAPQRARAIAPLTRVRRDATWN